MKPTFMQKLNGDNNFTGGIFGGIVGIGVGIYFVLDAQFDSWIQYIFIPMGILLLFGSYKRNQTLNDMFENGREVTANIVRMRRQKRSYSVKLAYVIDGIELTKTINISRRRGLEKGMNVTAIVHPQKDNRIIIKQLFM